MSEKIYAFLLRLYPPEFRKRYEEETIQLLRDRWRDERGSLRRLRLGFDLVADIARSLPEAYRNSYSEPAALSPVARSVDSGQMFQSLHNEPIRRGAFVIAGTLTLTLIVVFGYLMELPMPSPAFRSNGNKSAIESVLERLNQQSPLGSTKSARSVDSDPVQTAGSKTEKRARSGMHVVPSTASNAPSVPTASHRAGNTLEPAKPLPSASAFEADFSNPATKPRSEMREGQQIAEANSGATSGRSTTSMSSRLQTFADVPAGLSGRWIDYPVISADAEFPGGLILVQRSTVLSGFGELGSSNRTPIIHGSVAGKSVRFELSDGRKSFQYDLKVEDEELRGILSIRNGNETRRATVRLRRAR